MHNLQSAILGLRPNGDEWSDFFEERRANSLDIPQVVYRFKRAFRCAVINNALRQRLADAWQSIELGLAGSIDVEQLLRRRLVLRGTAAIGCRRRLAQARHMNVLPVAEPLGQVDLLRRGV